MNNKHYLDCDNGKKSSFWNRKTCMNTFIWEGKLNNTSMCQLCNTLGNSGYNIRELVLDSVTISNNMLQLLVCALSFNRTVTCLSLASNRLRPSNVRHLTTLSSSRLRALNLRGNQLGNEGIKSLITVLKNNELLEHINIEDNGVGDLGVELLAQYFTPEERSPNLDHRSERATISPIICLNNNQFTKIGLKCLLHLCTFNRNILVLDISGNHHIGDSSTDMLVRFVSTNSSLEHLDISDTAISPRGLQKIENAAMRSNALLSISGGNYCRTDDDSFRNNSLLVSSQFSIKTCKVHSIMYQY
jgi:NLR family CARD domain-containing protein 3